MVDPLVCPEGHHSVELGRDRAWCEACRLAGKQASFPRSAVRDARQEGDDG